MDKIKNNFHQIKFLKKNEWSKLGKFINVIVIIVGAVIKKLIC